MDHFIFCKRRSGSSSLCLAKDPRLNSITTKRDNEALCQLSVRGWNQRTEWSPPVCGAEAGTAQKGSSGQGSPKPDGYRPHDGVRHSCVRHRRKDPWDQEDRDYNITEATCYHTVKGGRTRCIMNRYRIPSRRSLSRSMISLIRGTKGGVGCIEVQFGNSFRAY